MIAAIAVGIGEPDLGTQNGGDQRAYPQSWLEHLQARAAADPERYYPGYPGYRFLLGCIVVYWGSRQHPCRKLLSKDPVLGLHTVRNGSKAA